MPLIITEEPTTLVPNAHGGTELMQRRLRASLDPALLGNFQIIASRVRDLSPDKIRILWLHDTWDDPENERLKDVKYVKQFAMFVFVSHFQQQTYLQVYPIPRSRCIVLRNAIETFPVSQKPNDGITRLIYHTTPHRGLEILVPVFLELAKDDPNIHLDVFSSFNAYGWAERDKPYEFLFEKCRQHPQITYHGFQPNEKVRETLDKADIFAYPSIWEETSCIAAMEAMSAKVAIVSSNLGALPETTAGLCTMYRYHEKPNSHAGIFFDVLRDTIASHRAGKLENMVAFAKVYADGLYDWNQRSKEWDNFLRSLLKTTK